MIADSIQRLTLYVSVLLGCLLCLRVLWEGWKAWRAGLTPVVVWARLTVLVIGFAVSLAGAVAGGRSVYTLLPGRTAPVPGLVAQAAGALLASDLAARMYGRWFSAPLHRWLLGEESPDHG